MLKPLVRLGADRATPWGSVRPLLRRIQSEGKALELVFEPEEPAFDPFTRWIEVPLAPAGGPGARLSFPDGTPFEEVARTVLATLRAGAAALAFE